MPGRGRTETETGGGVDGGTGAATALPFSAAIDAGPGFAVLRLLAMVLVLLFHAAIPYSAVRDPSLLWLAYEPGGGAVADGIVYVTRGLHMPLFFVLAGFWAEHACRKGGAGRFVAQRFRRLAVPLVVGMATVLPLTYAVWHYGLQVSGGLRHLSAEQWTTFPRGLPRNLRVGFGHLWYLEYLLLISVAYGLLRAGRGRMSSHPAGGRAGWLARVPGKPLLAAVPTFLILWYDPGVWTKSYPPIAPPPVRVLHYAVFFAAGAGLACLPDPRRTLAPSGLVWLAASVPAFGCAWAVGAGYAGRPLEGTPRLALAASVALSTWLAIFGLVGTCLRLRRLPHPRLQPVFDASFWVYWSHLPLLGLAQLALLSWPIPGAVKIAIVTGVTLTGCLASYPVVARGRLGYWFGLDSRPATPGGQRVVADARPAVAA